MALEKLVVSINDLDPTSPGPADAKSQGDDHLRNIKTAVKNCFPGFAGPVLVGGLAGGVVDAYTLAPATALTGYAANTLIVWMPNITNATGTVSMNASGLGARAIRSVAGAPLLPGDLVANQYAAMVDTGTEYRLIGVTKNYVDNLAFSSMLPTPPAMTGQYFLAYENGVFVYLTPPVPGFLLHNIGIV
jgi:hypothetical protein